MPRVVPDPTPMRITQTTDIGWAPISSALILYLYGNNIFAGEI